MRLLAAFVFFWLSMSGSTRGAVLHVVGDEPVPMQALKRVLESGGHQVTLFEQKEFASSGGKSPAAILMYVHGELEESVGKRLIAFTREGGRLVILHHGIASAKNKSPYWMEFVGIEILPKNAPEYPWAVIYGVEFEMVNLAPGHPVTTQHVNYMGTTAYSRSEPQQSKEQNLSSFIVPDTEAYLNQRFRPGHQRTLLFGMKCKDPVGGAVYMQDTGGWVMKAGKGWMFYLQPGHFGRDFEVPQLRQVLLNCLSWKAR
jgi:type 1 glutamine amidotransferase